MRRADPQRMLTRPHAGLLLYEKVYGVRSEDVLRASAPERAEVAGDEHRRSLRTLMGTMRDVSTPSMLRAMICSV